MAEKTESRIPVPTQETESTRQGRASGSMGVAVGIAIGTAIGVATDNLALWLSLGVAIGVSLSAANTRRQQQIDEAKKPNKAP